MKSRIVIGSRGSNLALTQARYVADLLRSAHRGLEVDIQTISTKGDQVLDKPLPELGGKGVFTFELESALRDGRIDLAVHSLKDLPTEESDGLAIAAIPPRATPNDAFVCSRWPSLDALPQGSRIGTSSLRRRAQLLAARPDLAVPDIRGNVETRMRRITDGEVDAVVLACAGLERIGREDAISQVLPAEIMVPAPAQGALGIQCRSDDAETHALLAPADCAETRAAVTAERTFLAELGGGCQVPLGALAVHDAETLTLTVCVCSLDGATVLRDTFSGDATDPEGLGRTAVEALVQRGADELVAQIK